MNIDSKPKSDRGMYADRGEQMLAFIQQALKVVEKESGGPLAWADLSTPEFANLITDEMINSSWHLKEIRAELLAFLTSNLVTESLPETEMRELNELAFSRESERNKLGKANDVSVFSVDELIKGDVELKIVEIDYETMWLEAIVTDFNRFANAEKGIQNGLPIKLKPVGSETWCPIEPWPSDYWFSLMIAPDGKKSFQHYR
jgi:hypothetical protein